MTQASGEFGPVLERASLSMGPEQNLWTLGSAPNPKGKDQPEWIPFSFNLAAGGSQTFYSDSGIPEFWTVTVMPNTGILVSVTSGPNANPNGLFLAGGGTLRIPGFTEYLSIVNLAASSNNAVGNVVAGRGYEDMFINPGQNR